MGILSRLTIPRFGFSKLGSDRHFKSEHRAESRFPVVTDLPFKIILELNPKDEFGRPMKTSQRWTGTLTDVSAGGANIHIHPAASSFKGDKCKLVFGLIPCEVDFEATVARFANTKHYATCGLQLNFQSEMMQKFYLSLIKPLSIGASLHPQNERTNPDGTIERHFGGEHSSRLVARTVGNDTLESFVLSEEKYVLKYEGAKANITAHSGKLRQEDVEEARWLFHVAIHNLNRGFPDQLKALLVNAIVG